MRVRDAMRQAWGLDTEVTIEAVVEAIQTTGCETLPIVEGSDDRLAIRQLVSVRDLPRLKQVEASAERGHAVGYTVLEMLSALGRLPGRFPTIDPNATLLDAWGVMSEEGQTHLPVVDHGRVVGMLALVVTISELPHRTPAAGFWR
jgi:CBS-domain-containing membrane protein